MKVIRLTVRLWAEYTRQVRAGRHLRPKTEARWQAQVDQLVIEHMPLADKIARQVWRTFTRAGQGGYSSRIDVEDMISCAWAGGSGQALQSLGRRFPALGLFARAGRDHPPKGLWFALNGRQHIISRPCPAAAIDRAALELTSSKDDEPIGACRRMGLAGDGKTGILASRIAVGRPGQATRRVGRSGAVPRMRRSIRRT